MINPTIFSGKVIGARRAMGDYSAIAKVQETDVWAEDEYGETIADGEAGVDDVSVIQAALDQSGLIILKKGRYIINDELQIGEKTKLIGEGWDTILEAATGAYLVITTKGSYGSKISDIVIRDLAIDCKNIAYRGINFKGGPADGVFPEGAYAEHSRIKNVKITDFKSDADNIGVGILFGVGAESETDGYNVQVEKCNIVGRGETENREYGILCDGRKHRSGLVADNFINNCRFGISIDDGMSGLEIRNNKILNGEVGIRGASLGAAGAYYYDVDIINNKIEGTSSYGIRFRNFRRSDCESNRIVNAGTQGIRVEGSEECGICDNKVYASSDSGIVLSAALRNRIIKNTVWESGKWGIYLGTGCNHNTINDNVVFNNSQAAANSYDGLYIKASLDCVVTGNQFFDDQETPTQRYGIYEGTGSDYNVIISNSCRGNATGGINITGANTLYETATDGDPLNIT